MIIWHWFDLLFALVEYIFMNQVPVTFLSCLVSFPISYGSIVNQQGRPQPQIDIQYVHWALIFNMLQGNLNIMSFEHGTPTTYWLLKHTSWYFASLICIRTSVLSHIHLTQDNRWCMHFLRVGHWKLIHHLVQDTNWYGCMGDEA